MTAGVVALVLVVALGMAGFATGWLAVSGSSRPVGRLRTADLTLPGAVVSDVPPTSRLPTGTTDPPVSTLPSVTRVTTSRSEPANATATSTSLPAHRGDGDGDRDD